MAARDLYLHARGKFESGNIVILDYENVRLKKKIFKLSCMVAKL